MQVPLIPPKLLDKADRILFISHLAIGDFAYYQNYFRALAKAYPHIKIDIWVDELRRTRCFWRWKYLKKYVLYDWVESCNFINKVYKQTYSPALLKKSLQEARSKNYPIVVSLATLRAYQYANLARHISPNGFVTGMWFPTHFVNVFKRLAYRKLNAFLDFRSMVKNVNHISNVYADFFKTLFGLDVSIEDRFPFINIPNQWISYAKLRFLKWEIDKESNKFGKVFFINPYAKDQKRCWPLEKVISLIKSIKKQDRWGDSSFIVNIVPEKMAPAAEFFQKHSLTNTFLFSADYNFFQLPAIMSLCDLIISVETAVMHLATAQHLPLIALMRQKNPEWAPLGMNKSYIVTTNKRRDWIVDIDVSLVIDAVALHNFQQQSGMMQDLYKSPRTC